MLTTWVDYFDNKATTSNNYLEISDMHIGDEVANSQFLNEEKIRLFNLLQPNPDFTLVDLGCCTGVCLGLLKEYYKKSIGIDLSKNVLNIAQKRLPDCEFILDDISSPEYIPSGIAEHVLSYGLLHYLSDKQLAGYIDTVYTTLKPGGRAVIMRTPNKEHFEKYQEYRNKRNNTRLVTSNHKLQWNWISPSFIKELCANRFDIIIILPTTGVSYPLKGFFDFVLVKKNNLDQLSYR